LHSPRGGNRFGADLDWRRHSHGHHALLRPNTCALAPYVTLTEAGAKFEVRSLNYRKREHFTPEYLKINPSTRCRRSRSMESADGEHRHPRVGPSDIPAAQILPADRGSTRRPSRCTAGAPAASIRI
jgi:hypothetical protein